MKSRKLTPEERAKRYRKARVDALVRLAELKTADEGGIPAPGPVLETMILQARKLLDEAVRSSMKARRGLNP